MSGNFKNFSACGDIPRVFLKLFETHKGHPVELWLRHYARSRKVERSRPDEANFLSVFNRNEYQKQKKNISGVKALPVRRADRLDNVGSLTSYNPIGLQGLY
jgi:hypothetical protein